METLHDMYHKKKRGSYTTIQQDLKRTQPSARSLIVPTYREFFENLCHVVARWPPKICRARAREGKAKARATGPAKHMTAGKDHHAIWQWW